MRRRSARGRRERSLFSFPAHGRQCVFAVHVLGAGRCHCTPILMSHAVVTVTWDNSQNEVKSLLRIHAQRWHKAGCSCHHQHICLMLKKAVGCGGKVRKQGL